MGLPDYIVKQFVQITNDSNSSKEDPIIYGTVEEHNGTKYVRIDGSSEITPVTLTVAAKDGDRVTLSIKNHTATVTGNLTDPSASGKDLAEATITINGMEIKMKGLVTFESLTAEGTTVIDGSRIQTGTIDADRLNLTGAITFNDLSSAVQSDIEDAWDMADEAWDMADDAYDLASDVDDVVYGWTYGSTTYIDGSMIKAGTVMASNLLGGTVGLLNSSEDEVGALTISGSSSSTYSIKLSSDGALALYGYGGNVHIESEDGAEVLLASEVRLGGGNTRPNGSGYTCGTSSYKWSDVYSQNSSCNTSDREAKTEIEYGLGRYSDLFDDLKPVSFKFKENESDRRHMGLIAQDVEESMNKLDISSKDFATFIKSPRKNDDGEIIEDKYDYSLRYGELIALCVEQIQMLKARVAELENQNGVQ